jgi:hypothetical protein
MLLEQRRDRCQHIYLPMKRHIRALGRGQACACRSVLARHATACTRATRPTRTRRPQTSATLNLPLKLPLWFLVFALMTFKSSLVPCRCMQVLAFQAGHKVSALVMSETRFLSNRPQHDHQGRIERPSKGGQSSSRPSHKVITGIDFGFDSHPLPVYATHSPTAPGSHCQLSWSGSTLAESRR